jgi:hypothetical protein
MDRLLNIAAAVSNASLPRAGVVPVTGTAPTQDEVSSATAATTSRSIVPRIPARYQPMAMIRYWGTRWEMNDEYPPTSSYGNP